jgi:site-specific DNA recombinase
MVTTTKKVIKCAIYTRKSSEEGLEQDFNSLDAQREACEAYIKSQQHEGWVLIEKQYNDGGFSGGTLERPAVKELFQDIEAGEIDTVVVYKVDRLTRSLMDFSKIVELFDKHSASFVSITQQFNTTTSMGRLTLNILLSFAQFEREVTGERIRDKKAATAQKGMRIGGVAPIGYKLENKKLIQDEIYASTVTTIFEKYLELKSVPLLMNYLKYNNIKTRDGFFFGKGSLYHILINKTYIGLVTHKEKSYEGEHKAIIDVETFKKVQKLLEENRIIKKSALKAQNPSLLAGKIFDDKGNYMSPSHSNTRNRKYRYYVSQALIQSRRNEAGSVSKIPASEIETFVKQEIKNFLADTTKMQTYFENFKLSKQKDLLLTAKNLQKVNPSNAFIRSLINKIVIYKEKVEIIICKDQLLKALGAMTYNLQMPEELKNETESPILITKNIKISSTANNGSILIISDSKRQESNINPLLIKAIAKSFSWNKLLLSGEVKSSTDIQKRENLKTNTYVKYILRLRFLAPDIVESILNGTQPKDMTIEKLFKVNTLDWAEQRKVLNF